MNLAEDMSLRLLDNADARNLVVDTYGVMHRTAPVDTVLGRTPKPSITIKTPHTDPAGRPRRRTHCVSPATARSTPTPR
jgi:hypothetical protein